MNKRIYQGHFTRKRFGQHFLTNQSIINNIVAAFNPKSDQAIIEIGPGLGALTLPVSKHIKNMIGIEIDYNLAARLAIHPDLNTKLTIIQQDAMTIDFSAIARKMGQLLRVFGNLPYNISTALILYLFSFANTFLDMNFMLQKEVVDSLIAKPNTKSYGRLSIKVQYYCQVIPILEVQSSAFTPPPKVDSVFVHLIPHQEKLNYDFNVKLLDYITFKAFNQRRKCIRNSLSDLFSVQDFKQLSIDPNCRAENVSVKTYYKLACRLSKTVI